MRPLCLLLAALAAAPAAPAGAPAEKHNGKLLILGIAFNAAPDKKRKETVASYNYCAEEFAQLLHDGGGPVYRQVEAHTLLGRQATQARCLAELARLGRATKQDVVVLGVYGHAVNHDKLGWGLLTADGQTLWGHQIKGVLDKLPGPAVVVVETVTSAAFVKAHRKDVPLPANVTALCAVRPPRHGVNALGIAVAEALAGKADYDRDGVVEAGELVVYVRRRCKELDPAGDAPELVEAKAGPPRLPLTTVAEGLVAVAVNDEWYQARLLRKAADGTFRVRPLGWDGRPGPYFLAESVDRDHICLPADPPPVKVEVNGKPRLARLVKKDGTQWRVQLLGNDKEISVPRSKVTQLFGTEIDKPNKRKRK